MKKTAPEPIRIVLAGIGGYGIHYVKTLLQREQQGAPLKLVALVDPAAKASPVYPQVSGLPCFQDLEACLRVHPADLVILSSPIQFHAEQIRTALAHRAHVLCEKPLCATRQQGLDLIEAQAAAGLQVGIGYQWSFSPAILRALEDVRAGLYGVPQVFRTRVYWPRSDAISAATAGQGASGTARDARSMTACSITPRRTTCTTCSISSAKSRARRGCGADRSPIAALQPDRDLRYRAGPHGSRPAGRSAGRAGTGRLACDSRSGRPGTGVPLQPGPAGGARRGPARRTGRCRRACQGLWPDHRTGSGGRQAGCHAGYRPHGAPPACDIRTAYAQTAVLASIHERARLERVPEAAKIKTWRDQAN